MKKLFSFLLVALMVVSCMTMTALASESDGTYVVTFSVKNNPGIGCYGIHISYDSTVMTLTDITGGGLASGNFTSNINAKKNHVADMVAGWIEGDGVLFTATFKLTDAAVAGKTYTVTATLDTASTETADGKDTFEIVVSGGSITVPAAACKHEHTKIINEKAATCTEDGYTGDTYCEDCKTTIEYGKAIDKLGHTWGEGKVTKNPTCTEKGEMTYTCTCGETKTEPISATGHKNTEIRNAKEATCGEAGYTGDTWCKDCKTKISEGKVIPATGNHSYQTKVTREPTCTVDGEMTYTCEVCGGTKTEPIPATNHKYTGKVTKEPTCTENGEMTYTCEACGDSYTEEIDTDGHHYQDGKCVDCGEKDPNYSEKDNSDLDDVPKTGDITPMLTGAAVVLVLLGGTAALVIKRKFCC